MLSVTQSKNRLRGFFQVTDDYVAFTNFFMAEHTKERYRKQAHIELDTSLCCSHFTLLHLFHVDIYEIKRRTGILLHGFILCCQKIMDANIRSTLTVKGILLKNIQ